MYSGKIKSVLKKISADIGDIIEIASKGKKYIGKLMPHTSESAEDTIVVKLDNGYNIGLMFDSKTKVRKLSAHKPKEHIAHNIRHDPNKPTVLILHTGGTIASKVDYETG